MYIFHISPTCLTDWLTRLVRLVLRPSTPQHVSHPDLGKVTGGRTDHHHSRGAASQMAENFTAKSERVTRPEQARQREENEKLTVKLPQRGPAPPSLAHLTSLLKYFQRADSQSVSQLQHQYRHVWRGSGWQLWRRFPARSGCVLSTQGKTQLSSSLFSLPQ